MTRPANKDIDEMQQLQAIGLFCGPGKSCRLAASPGSLKIYVYGPGMMMGAINIVADEPARG